MAALATELGLEGKTFSLDDRGRAGCRIARCTPVVLHCAGPFIHTYRQMAEGCLRTGVPYVDITGEMAVYEGLWGLDAGACRVGVMLMPSVGYDVVPSDCLAAHLKRRLPAGDPSCAGVSGCGRLLAAWTALTGVEMGGRPGIIRRVMGS